MPPGPRGKWPQIFLFSPFFFSCFKMSYGWKREATSFGWCQLGSEVTAADCRVGRWMESKVWAIDSNAKTDELCHTNDPLFKLSKVPLQNLASLNNTLIFMPSIFWALFGAVTFFAPSCKDKDIHLAGLFIYLNIENGRPRIPNWKQSGIKQVPLITQLTIAPAMAVIRILAPKMRIRLTC